MAAAYILLTHVSSVQGLAWIEVKAHEPFDIDSNQWLGNPGHFKGACSDQALLHYFVFLMAKSAARVDSALMCLQVWKSKQSNSYALHKLHATS